jgi:hypothetical protein
MSNLPYDPTQAGDICRRKHGGNRESEAAYRSPGKREMSAKIATLYSLLGLAGATPDEVAALLGLPDKNKTAPRISELKRDGILIPTNQTRKTRTGSTAKVLVHKDFDPIRWVDERTLPFTNEI